MPSHDPTTGPSAAASVSRALAPALAPLRRARRRVLLHRRALAAVTAALAVLLAVQASRPAPSPTVTVWAAARTLEGGALLSASSITAVEVPPDLVPDGAVADPDEVLGRPLAGPVTRGETLTDLRVVGPGLARAYPGSTAVPVRFADAEVVELLRSGDRVDVVAAPQDGAAPATVVVRDVPVVAVPRPSDQGPTTGAPGRLVVLAVPSAEAAAVATATATAILIPVWSR